MWMSLSHWPWLVLSAAAAVSLVVTFRQYLELYVDETRAAGGTPISHARSST